jgi:hypothetical protein
MKNKLEKLLKFIAQHFRLSHLVAWEVGTSVSKEYTVSFFIVSTLKMEAIYPSETPVAAHQATRCQTHRTTVWIYTSGSQPLWDRGPVISLSIRRETRARYNWCQGRIPGRGPAVEKHWSTALCIPNSFLGRKSVNFYTHISYPAF